MRGKGNLYLLDGVLDGITPAYAGKRKSQQDVTWHTGDHPRVCGEKKREIAAGRDVAGSPPRMRGQVDLSHQPESFARITPAYAGKRVPEDILFAAS